jgi:hypothetical protein
MDGDLDAFARACKDTSRQLRRIPADLRRELSSQVQPQVAVPLAAKIANNLTGPWATPLAASTKARKLADPTIVIGGAKRVVSGGASARQLVYGVTFGGGSRVTTTTRRTRNGGRPTTYKLPSTRQFRGKGNDQVFGTIRAEGAWVLEQFANIVDDVLGKALNG